MKKRHPLADEIKRFVDAPDDWQWQIYVTNAAIFAWKNATIEQVLEWEPDSVRLIPKRTSLPSDRLPVGWKVERVSGYYKLYIDEEDQGCFTTSSLVGALIRHLDPLEPTQNGELR